MGQYWMQTNIGILGRSPLPTCERYFITISILVNKGSGVLSCAELEELSILNAQRISLSHEFDAPEFYYKTLFQQFIRNLTSDGILTEDPNGKLQLDDDLKSTSEDVKLVMSTELRHGIIQVAQSKNPIPGT